jgi:hypothetical protein
LSDEATNPDVEAAMKLLQEAFKFLTPDERTTIREIQAAVDAAAEGGTVADPRLEFCYTVKISTDRINNVRLLKACEAYIAATESKS